MHNALELGWNRAYRCHSKEITRRYLYFTCVVYLAVVVVLFEGNRLGPSRTARAIRTIAKEWLHGFVSPPGSPG